MKKLLKDKKITIYNPEYTTSTYGDQIAKYKPIHAGKLWAYVRHLSGNEIFAAMTVQSVEEMLFVINWRSDINTYNVIEYKGDWYNITRIDTFEDYKENLSLYAKRLTRPMPEADIIPY